MRTAVIAISTLAVLATAARADDAADLKGGRAVLDAQLAALRTGDGKAFAATFRAEGAAVLLPTLRDVVTGRPAIAAAVGAWSGKATTVALAAEPVFGQKENGDDAMVHVTADVAIGGRPHRLTALYATTRPAPWAAVAFMLSEPVPDQALRGEKPPAPPGEAEHEFAPMLTSPKAMVRDFGWGDSNVVIGSSAKEKGSGKAGEKLLKQWRGLKLTLVGTPVTGQVDFVYGFAAGRVSMARKGKLPVTFNALLIVHPDFHQYRGAIYHVLSVHYAQAR